MKNPIEVIKIVKVMAAMAVLISIGCGGGGDDPPPVVPEPKTDAPKAAILAFPLKDAECNEGTILSDNLSTVTFEWNAAEFATSYTVSYENLNTNETKESSSSGTTEQVDLQRGAPYAWKVISKSNKTSETATSETWKFYNAGQGVQNYAPFPAELVSPPMGGLDSTDVTLVWKGVDVDGDIVGYDVYLNISNPPMTLLEATTVSNVAANGLTVDTVYYWKVVTKDSHGNITESPVFEFRTQ